MVDALTRSEAMPHDAIDIEWHVCARREKICVEACAVGWPDSIGRAQRARYLFKMGVRTTLTTSVEFNAQRYTLRGPIPGGSWARCRDALPTFRLQGELF